MIISTTNEEDIKDLPILCRYRDCYLFYIDKEGNIKIRDFRNTKHSDKTWTIESYVQWSLDTKDVNNIDDYMEFYNGWRDYYPGLLNE